MPASGTTIKVLLPEPGEAMLEGEKLAVIDIGMPETARVTGALNPPVAKVVTVMCPVVPAGREISSTAGFKVKPGAVPTVTDTSATRVMLPLVAEIISG
jgi:hypothetical protein